MHPWCRNVEIFENIDAGEGFGFLNPPKSLADAISMPCGAGVVEMKWLVETE